MYVCLYTYDSASALLFLLAYSPARVPCACLRSDDNSSKSLSPFNPRSLPRVGSCHPLLPRFRPVILSPPTMPQLLPQQLHRHHHDIRRVHDHVDPDEQDADGEDAPPFPHPSHPSNPSHPSYHHGPTFNLLIVGRPRTGKTALARLLLDTSTLSPAISPSRINLLADYANATIRPTSAITCATAELSATPKRSTVTLNIFDTPGIDFQDQAAFEASITLIHRHISDTYRASEDLPVRFLPLSVIPLFQPFPSEVFLTL